MRGFYQRHCVYLPAIAGWFVCSAALTAFNKVVFGANRGAFPCPLLFTSCHFLIQWTFSYSVSSLFPDFFGGAVVKNMSWKTYLGISLPCGIITAADIGMSNLSIVRITITFFTMIKSSAPIWVLLSGFIFGLFPITPTLIMVGVLITMGEVLTSFGEVEFDVVGFLLCAGAAVCGGVRWTLIQFKLQKLDPPLGGPIVTMRVLSSTMFFSMLALSFIIEKPWIRLGPESGTEYFSDFESGMKTILLGLSGAFIAIAMVLCEFWLILKADAIVLMIGGVLKEMITIFLGVTVFGDNLNTINISGIVVVFSGIFLYKVTLHISKTEQHNMDESEIESTANFSRVGESDIYEDEELPKRIKRSMKNSDPDIALSYDFDIDDDDEEELMARDGLTPLRERSNMALSSEHDEDEEESLQVIT